MNKPEHKVLAHENEPLKGNPRGQGRAHVPSSSLDKEGNNISQTLPTRCETHPKSAQMTSKISPFW